jgi:hypothetical protein
MCFIAAPSLVEQRVLEWNAKIIRFMLRDHAQIAEVLQFAHVPPPS